MQNINNYDVCLVCMPFSSIVRPSIALGLLQSHLDKSNILCKTVYANIKFAEKIGLKYYSMIGSLCPSDFFLADWLFNKMIYSSPVLNVEHYQKKIYNSFLSITQPGLSFDDAKKMLDGLKEQASIFIDELAQQIISDVPKIVACTSSFHQHLASVALLKKVKKIDPSIVTMLGGANCEGKMGLATHRSFDFIDYVISGEADSFFSSLIDDILNGQENSGTQLTSAVLTPDSRRNNYQEINDQEMFCAVKNMDDLPYPNFDDYFSDLERSSLKKVIKPALLVESSRGCWWGQKHKCTFCGLNHPKAYYRTKSNERLLSEIEYLEDRYNIRMFEMTDNILNMKYFTDVLPKLNNNDKNRFFFYETKSNLNRSHFIKMKNAGITWIQPGVESLHTNILKLMNKGVSAWQNVQTIKLAREFGIRLSWNFLWGFPGENDNWYKEVSEWLPLIEHLQPPSSFLKIRIHRNSTYFNNKEQFGLDLSPMPAFKYVFPYDDLCLYDASYTFKVEGWSDTIWEPETDPYEERPFTKKVNDIIKRWQGNFSKFQPPVLSVTEKEEHLEIFDTRLCRKNIQYKITGLEKEIYIYCETNPQKNKLKDHFIDLGINPLQINEAIENLKEMNIIFELDNRYIALALRGAIPHLPSRNDFPGGGINENELENIQIKTNWEIEESILNKLTQIASK